MLLLNRSKYALPLSRASPPQHLTLGCLGCRHLVWCHPLWAGAGEDGAEVVALLLLLAVPLLVPLVAAGLSLGAAVVDMGGAANAWFGTCVARGLAQAFNECYLLPHRRERRHVE